MAHTEITVDNLNDDLREVYVPGQWLDPVNDNFFIFRTPFAGEVVSAFGIVASGSCTIGFASTGGAITGLDSLAVTSAGVEGTATGNNTFDANAMIKITVNNSLGPDQLFWQVVIRETRS